MGDHSAACSANPKCAALGIEGHCCPTNLGINLECCRGQGHPTPSPAPVPPGGNCAICVTGACAACKPCANIQTALLLAAGIQRYSFSFSAATFCKEQTLGRVGF